MSSEATLQSPTHSHTLGTAVVDTAKEIARRSALIDGRFYVKLEGKSYQVECRDTAGANVWNLTSQELNNVTKGTHHFLVACVTDKNGKKYNFAVCSFRRDEKNALKKALSDPRLKSILDTKEFAMDKLIVANEVYDCQTYVNRALGEATLAGVDSQPGKDIIEASKGHTLNFSRIAELAVKGSTSKISDYFDGLTPGHIVVFLKEVPKEDAEVMKKSVKLTKFNGKWYAPEHVAIYSGKDEHGQHMISQAHIYGGSILTEPAADYIIKNKTYFSAILSIPTEYFAQKLDKRRQILATAPKKNDS
ncbi:MAG: hypothetical protein QXU54_03465 [Candidatus Micrarchaeia archaeon]